MNQGKQSYTTVAGILPLDKAVIFAKLFNALFIVVLPKEPR